RTCWIDKRSEPPRRRVRREPGPLLRIGRRPEQPARPWSIPDAFAVDDLRSGYFHDPVRTRRPRLRGWPLGDGGWHALLVSAHWTGIRALTTSPPDSIAGRASTTPGPRTTEVRMVV